jgi:hypothetical protein
MPVPGHGFVLQFYVPAAFVVDHSSGVTNDMMIGSHVCRVPMWSLSSIRRVTNVSMRRGVATITNQHDKDNAVQDGEDDFHTLVAVELSTLASALEALVEEQDMV